MVNENIAKINTVSFICFCDITHVHYVFPKLCYNMHHLLLIIYQASLDYNTNAFESFEWILYIFKSSHNDSWAYFSKEFSLALEIRGKCNSADETILTAWKCNELDTAKHLYVRRE